MTIELSSPREVALTLAAEIITKNRNKEYGEPEDNFQCIADIWNWWLGDRIDPGRPITALDVAELLDGMKKARRRANSGHADSYIDTCGYIACGYEIMNRQLEKEPGNVE